MSLLVVQGIEKSFGADTVLHGLNLRLEWRQKLGLIGRNGTGKTTLLRILAGQMAPDTGTIQYAHGIQFGYLRQEAAVDSENTVLQEAEAAFAHVREMERRMHEAERQLADLTGEEQAVVLEEYGLLCERFDQMGGYEALRDVPLVLSRLGFAAADLDKPCSRLSGGEKTRLAIARLLLSGPDILYLDEPTNHLDIEATEWLEGYLRDFGGALLLVSHDRVLLDHVVTGVAELERSVITVTPGNYSAWRVQKQMRDQRQAEVHEREQREIARLTEFFEKWKNTPSKRSQAVMRKRWADRIRAGATAAPVRAGSAPRLGVKSSAMSGEEVLAFNGLGKRFGDRVLFTGLSGLIRRGERVGIAGPNGSGKSTFVRMVIGREAPSEGYLRLGASVTMGYFAQETGDLDLDSTVIENFLAVADVPPQTARTHLGRFLFTGDDVYRQVRLLSGGEKNRLALAQITWLRPNLLILDEPTNHLDVESREALAAMLQAYDGTLLLVSHDRYLLNAACDRTLAIANGAAVLFDGTYNQMRASGVWPKAPTPDLGPIAGHATSGQPRSGSHPDIDAMNAFDRNRERRRMRSVLAAAEAEIARLERRLGAIESALSAPQPGDDIVGISQEHGGVQAALNRALAHWEAAAARSEYLETASAGQR
ncbi:MAG: ABC-F family ATP-binding cassette domain-containing protein [Armatimonadetes bacterium]|nr:ABC-F family ATP-binding cassette domain-containing protein [Armatimonadota bacterium]MDE2206667.1 ABC-F family ATP-binding cassette domain-containing protein [Armatimonadota bacterium]